MRAFGVGLIGVQAGRSWAAKAHIPALTALNADFTIVGIANTTLESAQAAVEQTGIGKAYASVDELVNDRDIDVVVVTVKVPHHYEIVMKAIEAGKSVYCEWPLGRTLPEAEIMAKRAQDRGVIAVAGTQARGSAALRYVNDLVAQRFVGDVLSSTLVGSGMNWGPTIEQANAYTLDNSTGANMLTIPVGHTLAALTDALGKISDVRALLASRRQTVRVVETGEDVRLTAPDQVLIAATLENGAPLAVHYRGGMPKGTGFLWEINGTEGDIQVQGAGGHAQFVKLSVKGRHGEQALEALRIPPHFVEFEGLPLPAQNVAVLYKQMANDLRNGTRTAPRFSDAVAIHRVIAAVEQSAAENRTISLDWGN